MNFIFFVADHYSPLYHSKFIEEKLESFQFITIEDIYKSWQTPHQIDDIENKKYISEWEEKYCAHRNMNELISTHQGLIGWENSSFYYNITDSEKTEIVADTIKKFDKTIKSHHIQAIISLSRRTFISNLAFEYATSTKIPSITMIQSRIGDRWIFRDDFGLGTSKKNSREIKNTMPTDQAYAIKDALVRTNRAYTSFTHKQISEIRSALSKPTKYFLTNYLKITRRALSRFIYDKRSRKFRTTKLGENLLKLTIFEFRNLIFYFIRLIYFKKLFFQGSLKENSCAWFLHARPEDSTLVLGKGLDEIELIEKTAAMLPIDEVLYIKENALMLGVRKFGFYRKLRNMKNVKLLSPIMPNDIILKNCDRILGLSGTVLLESKILGKETFSLGVPEFLEILDNEKYESLENFVKKIPKKNHQPKQGIEIKYIQWILDNSSDHHIAFLDDLSTEKAKKCLSDLSERLTKKLLTFPQDLS